MECYKLLVKIWRRLQTSIRSLFPASLIALFVAGRVWRLTTYSLRADEIFSFQVAGLGSWREFLSAVVRDIVHPPLFYALLKIWVRVGGESEFWIRLLPVLTAVLAVWPFFLLCRELKLAGSERNLALLLFAVNAYLIYFSQELRMYSQLLFLTLCSFWLFVKFFNAARSTIWPLVALFAANLLLVYTQYYGWVIVALELMIVLGLRREKSLEFALSVAMLVLCFSPWAYLVTRVAVIRGGLESNIGSFARPHAADVIEYYATLNGRFGSVRTMILGQILFAYPILNWVWRLYRKKRTGGEGVDFTFWSLSLFSLLPVVFCYSVSHVLPQSVWGTRFLIIAAVPYLILVAVAAQRLQPIWLRSATVVLIAGWALYSNFTELDNTGKHAWEPLVYRMIGAETSQGENIMVYAFDSSDETIAFYLKKVNETRFRTKRVFALSDFGGDHFWVASNSRDEQPQQFFRDRGYRVGQGFPDGFGALLSPVWRR